MAAKSRIWDFPIIYSFGLYIYFSVFLKGCISFMWPLFLRECFLVELLNILESSLIEILNLLLRFKVPFRVPGPPRDPKKCLRWYKFENQND